jgi:hypothetical protein
MTKDDVLQALANVTPEQLQAILAQGHGRSPMKPRQLHDLRLAPTATDPRPLFIPSAEGPREMPPQPFQPCPKLLWHKETGQEITVMDAIEEKAKGDDWISVSPRTAAIDPVTFARQMFEALSPEDQQLVLEHQRKAKVDAVTKAMSGLTSSQLDAAVSAPEKKGRKAS